MEGDDLVRFCGQCRKSVYNVAALTRQEALSLIERTEGQVCLRITGRSDGTLVTGDCWARLRRARRRGLLAFIAALPVVLAIMLWSQAFGLRALGRLVERRSTPPVMDVTARAPRVLPVVGAIAPPPAEERPIDKTTSGEAPPPPKSRATRSQPRHKHGKAEPSVVMGGAPVMD